MKNKVLMGLAAIAMVAFLSSCGKVPQADIDATNAAIAAAQAAEANVYVPTEFTALQDSMNAINAAVETQKSKLFKKFGPIKGKLASTLNLAKQVATDAGTKKDEAKKQAEGLLNDIKGVMDENGKLILKAPRGKEGVQLSLRSKPIWLLSIHRLLTLRLLSTREHIWMLSTRSKLPKIRLTV